MEGTLKDLCRKISSLSTDFSFLGRSNKLPLNVQSICTRIGIELIEFEKFFYNASFINNDTKITMIVDEIKKITDEADQINEKIAGLTGAVKKARELVTSATEQITKLSTNYKKVLGKMEKGFSEIEKILDVFGIESDLV